ncbi:Ankyrin repeat domain-containing protein 16 [Chamberlinius hualienensis]
MSSTSFKQLLEIVRCGDVDNLNKYINVHKTQCIGRLCNWCNNNYHCKSGDSLAHIAARCGHVNILSCLKKELAYYNFEQANFDGKRPIHEAAQSGHAECLRYLISLNVDINCLKKADWTPLMLSCAKDNFEVVNELVASGAQQDIKNKDGWTAFHIACRAGHLDIVSLLLHSNVNAWKTVSKNGRTPLHTAALHGCNEIVKLLIEEGGYVTDEQDHCESTPLMDALRANHVDVARNIVTLQGADVRLKDKLGRQALHHAAQAGSVQSLLYLINEFLVDPNVEDFSGVTALQLARKESFPEVIQLLIQAGGIN